MRLPGPRSCDGLLRPLMLLTGRLLLLSLLLPPPVGSRSPKARKSAGNAWGWPAPQASPKTARAGKAAAAAAAPIDKEWHELTPEQKQSASTVGMNKVSWTTYGATHGQL
eukprot:SAG22_NODE_5599_length_987_cov_0.826577_1_plen_110_part_00